jgi:hypothetical protein
MSQLGQLISVVTGVTSLTGDSGGALSGALKIKGGSNITTAAAGTDITVNVSGTTNHAIQLGNVGGSLSSLGVGATGTVLTGVTGADPAFSASPTVTTMYAGTFDTNVAAAAVTLSGTTLSADGTDVDININITAKGAGKVIIDDLQLTTDLAVTEGGTGVSTLLDHGLLVGSGAAAIDSVAVGATGTILQGVTANDPTWSTATYPSTVTKGDVLVASANNVVGVVNDVVNAGYLLTANVGAAPTFQAPPAGVTYASDAETIAGTVTNKAVAPSNLKAKLGTQTIHALPIGASDSAALGWLAVGTTGKYLRAATTADPGWSTLTLPDTVTKGDVLVASADNVVDIVAGATTAGWVLTANGALSAPTFQAPAADGITSVSGTANQITASTLAGAVTLSTPATFIAPGTIASTTTNTAGTNLISTAGDLLLPASNGATTQGSIRLNNICFLTSGWTTDNVLIGYEAGLPSNTTHSRGTFIGYRAGKFAAINSWPTNGGGTDNVGVGYNAMGLGGGGGGNANVSNNTAVGSYALAYSAWNSGNNTAVGYKAGYTGGKDVSGNTFVGYQAGMNFNYTFGGKCTAVGYRAGENWNNAGAGYNIALGESVLGVAGEANVMRLGCPFITSYGITTTYVAGIYNTAVGATAGVVLSDSSHQLGGLAGAANTILIGGTKPSFTGSPTVSGTITGNAISSTTTVTAGTDLISTAGNLKLPTSSSTVGQIQINSKRWLHAIGHEENVYVGNLAGNVAGGGKYNTIVGSQSGQALTNAGGGSEGNSNVILGHSSLNSATSGMLNCVTGTYGLRNVTSGNMNLALGCYTIGQALITGNYNVLIGHSDHSVGAVYYGAGYGYTGAESSNICIGASGTAGESNKIRIGTQGNGNCQQDALYIAGAYGVTPAGTLNIALVDSNGQFGSVVSLAVAQGGTGANSLTDHGILLGSGTGAITPLGVASDGQLAIGSTGADPVLATITAGANVTVTNGAGSITVASSINTVNDQTDSYQLVAGDAGKFITMTKGSANTLTVPKDATVNFAVGTYITVYQGGAGVTTIAPEDGTIVINSVAGNLDISAQYGVAKLHKIAANSWVAYGDLA